MTAAGYLSMKTTDLDKQVFSMLKPSSTGSRKSRHPTRAECFVAEILMVHLAGH